MAKPTAVLAKETDSTGPTDFRVYQVTLVQETFCYGTVRAGSRDKARARAIELISGDGIPLEDIGDPVEEPWRIIKVEGLPE